MDHFFIIPTAEILSGLNEWVNLQLSGAGNSPGSFIFIFLGGLIASMLPCVYPLYPITAGIIGKKAKEGYAHPLAYFFGLAFMYFLFGLIASLTGGAFNDLMRFPLVNIMIGLLVFVLGLSAIELLYIPIFHPHHFEEGQTGLKSTRDLCRC